MDDALTVSRSQTEESQAARMIYSTTGLFRQFIKSVDMNCLKMLSAVCGTKHDHILIWNMQSMRLLKMPDLPFVAGWMVCFQGTGLFEWKKQVTRVCVSSPGGGHPLPSGSHLLLSSSRGGTGA